MGNDLPDDNSPGAPSEEDVDVYEVSAELSRSDFLLLLGGLGEYAMSSAQVGVEDAVIHCGKLSERLLWANPDVARDALTGTQTSSFVRAADFTEELQEHLGVEVTDSGEVVPRMSDDATEIEVE